MKANAIDSSTMGSIKKTIGALNHNKKIKIRLRKTLKGYSIYFDLFFNNSRSYSRTYQNISGKKSTSQRDREALKIITIMRDKKELELLEKQIGFKLSNSKTKMNLIKYFSDIAKKKEHHNWNSCLAHLIRFKGKGISFNHIDGQFCLEFREYLLKSVGPNTAHSYYAKLKACLNQAVRDQIIQQNPARNIKIKTVEGTRVFLTEAELSKLIQTKCADIEVKNAFLFSCFTGLRISDVRELTFNNIEEVESNHILTFRQSKTKGIVRLKINPDALKIVEEQREWRKHSENHKIFLLPLDSGTANKVIRNWVKDASIEKKITYHCSRHTFATRGLTHDVDIYRISKLLGHSDIKTTEIYAKLINKKLDEAIDKLPPIL